MTEIETLRTALSEKEAELVALREERDELREEIDAARTVFTGHLLKYDEMVRQRYEAERAMEWQADKKGKQ